jgi:hypothetical protein
LEHRTKCWGIIQTAGCGVPQWRRQLSVAIVDSVRSTRSMRERIPLLFSWTFRSV